MANERVIAGGGGGAEAERPLHAHFAEWLGPTGRILYWSFALPETHPLRATCFEWINSVYQPLGISRIDMWTEPDGHSEAELELFDAIFIGGGNTYRLLHMLRESGFDNALLRWIQAGKPLYGGSAGAAILGTDIHTVAHGDQNLVGLADVRALDVLHGHAIWCHYEPQSDDPRIAAYIEAYNTPVLAISERSGIVLEGGRLSALGHEPAIRFTAEGRTVVEA
jgi:dipeptidase E